MKRHTIILLLLVAAISASCVKLGANPIDKHFYQITPARSAERAAQAKDMVLKVRRLAISDVYNTRELVYREPDGRVEADFYNMFFVAPADMLTTELRTWLRNSGQFSHIIEPGSMVIPGLTLEGVINSLYGDYTTDAHAAVVEMQFFVVDESTANNVIVFSSTYTQRIPISQADPRELVRAMTQGVEAIFTNLETDLAHAPLTK